VEEDEPGNEQKKMKSYLRQFIECVLVVVIRQWLKMQCVCGVDVHG
jgi:hypothetical protein